MNNGEQDVIILKGCGVQTKWHFPPNQNRCPVKKCGIAFQNRLLALTHYQDVHADYSILCPICQKPIIAKDKARFRRHYRLVHKTVELPYHIDANKKLTQMQQVRDKIHF